MLPQILTFRQQQELNKAILQYLKPICGDNASLLIAVSNALQTPLNTIDDNNNNIIPNYLEKKWLTVLRLQKRIIDLENEITTYKSLLDSSDLQAITLSKDKINWLPKNTSKTFKTLGLQLVHSVAIHPFLPVIHAGCSDGSLISWNVANDEAIPEKIIKAHTRAINKIKWSNVPVDLLGKSIPQRNKSYILATCLADLLIKIWDGATYKQLRILSGHEHTISSVAFSHTAPHILYSVSRDKTVRIWDLTTGFAVKSFIGHSDWVRDIDVMSIHLKLALHTAKASDLGDFCLTCSNDQSVRLSHPDSGTGISLLIGHTHVVEAVKFLPLHSNIHIDKYLQDNADSFPHIPISNVSDKTYTDELGFKYCVSAGRDNLVKLWLLPLPTLRPHRHPLPSLQNNSQGWHIADLVGHQSWVKSLTIHPSGRFIMSAGDDKTIRVWDLATLVEHHHVKCVRTLEGHEGFVNAVEFASYEPGDRPAADTPDQLTKYIESKMRCLLLSGGVDNTVRLWK